MKFNEYHGVHIKDNDTTSKIMTRLLIALMPIVCFTIFKNVIFLYRNCDISGFEAFHPIYIILTSIFVSYICEILWFKFVNKLTLNECAEKTRDSFTVIPGLLLSLVLPVNTPLWLVAFGSFCATIIGKMIFGGFGCNIFNPALIGYLLISASYPGMSGSYLNLYELDTIAGSTPLTNLASLNYLGSYSDLITPYGNIFNFLSGMIPGTLGETCKILIIIAFIYLAVTKTIKWKIPVCYVGTVFILTFLIGNHFNLGIYYPLFSILSGGLLFGAVFMATDPVTSPKTDIGQVFHGIALGMLTVALRYLTNYPEGVMTSILFMNMLVPLFDNIGIRVRNNKKRIIIPIVVFIALFTGLFFKVINKINPETEVVNDTVKIVNKTEENGNTVYEVTSEGWGVIKAIVKVYNGEIISIDVTDSSSETQWNTIENANYVNKVIENQKDIDNLDAVSGSTFSSDALKNIVRKIIEEEK